MTSAAERSFQIANGLGAGNIGDELMNRAFWDALPLEVELDVEVFPNRALQCEREPYPDRHRYVSLDWDGRPLPRPNVPGLLVGDTPVTESLSLDWPLRFLAPRLDGFHDAGLPVDAVGVGLEPLSSPEAYELFQRSFLPIRSWTVRSQRCQEILLDLGVPPNRIIVGADWAWLYHRRSDLREWARGVWRSLGVDPAQPLVVANVVNEVWRDRVEVKRGLAWALDALAERSGVQVAFFCNEMRDGAFFDRAAADEVRTLMARPSVVVPNLYYTPDEAIALLSHAAATVAGRYHFVVESVLAGTSPVTLARSDKMTGLLDDLGLESLGSLEYLEPERLIAAVEGALSDQGSFTQLREASTGLARRAGCNLELWLRFRGAQPVVARTIRSPRMS